MNIRLLHRHANPVRAGLLLMLAAGMTAPNAFADEPPQRLIVKYRSAALSVDATGSVQSKALSLPASRAGIALEHQRTMAGGADVLAIGGRRLSSVELRRVLSDIASDPNVEYAEEDRILKPLMTPNDPRYNEQWAYFDATAGLRLPAAWDSATGQGVVVAVIDTGVRPHADLAANLLPGYDFISSASVANDGNGRDADASDPGDATPAGFCSPTDTAHNSSWHGTHVAGTIAAVTNNGVGVAGVAYKAKVLPLRVLGRCGGYTSDIADAIVWASGGTVSGVPANPTIAKVINLSLGGSGSCDTTTQNAINTARSRGTVVVVAAGNANSDAINATPANCNGVIAVAATNRSGGRAYYSNYGSVVDVAAPGGAQSSATDANGILSTLNAGTTSPGADSYALYQGTSMATPHVAGVAALMLSKNPALTPDQTEALLKSSARAFPAACSQCGAGLVDANAAVAAAAALGGSTGSSGGSTTGGSGSSGGTSSACAVGYTAYTGTLAANGFAYVPGSTGYIALAGTHSGVLSGPVGTNFDLYLHKLVNNVWTLAASSAGAMSSESISYTGSAASYRFLITTRAGSGAYTLCVKRP